MWTDDSYYGLKVLLISPDENICLRTKHISHLPRFSYYSFYFRSLVRVEASTAIVSSAIGSRYLPGELLTKSRGWFMGPLSALIRSANAISGQITSFRLVMTEP